MEKAVRKRPMTRAWAALLASAEGDVDRATTLQREADQYLQESEAQAKRRIARRKAKQEYLSPAGATWVPDFASESELQRFGKGEGLGSMAIGSDTFASEVGTLVTMLSPETSWKVKVSAFERFQFLATRVEKANIDADALQELVGLMADEVVGLRGALVKKAAEATAVGVKLFNPEQVWTLVKAALSGRIKTKRIMSDAADGLARALLRECPATEVWARIADLATSSAHPTQRQSCVDYIRDLGFIHQLTGFDEIIQKVVSAAMLDRSFQVRDSAKKLFVKYREASSSKASVMLKSFPPDVASRLAPEGRSNAGESAKKLAARPSIRDMIRAKRLAKRQNVNSDLARPSTDHQSEAAGQKRGESRTSLRAKTNPPKRQNMEGDKENIKTLECANMVW